MTVPPFLPPDWDWVFDLVVGQNWPQADEDSLRQAAQLWTDALTGLLNISDDGSTAASGVGASVQSMSSEDFQNYWSAYVDGDDSTVGQMARQCAAQAEQLLAFAEQTEFAKWSIDIQIVLLVIQLVFDAVMAIVTAGASTAEGIAAAFLTRLTVKKIIFELVKAVLLATLPDLITQEIMLADHHRSSFDWMELGQAAQMGLIGGAAGTLLGVGMDKFGIAKGLTTRMGEIWGGFTTAALTGAATNLTVNGTASLVDTGEAMLFNGGKLPEGYAQQKTNENPVIAALNGAFTGALFHGVHEFGTHVGGGSFRPTAFQTGDTTLLAVEMRGDGAGTYAVFDENRTKLLGTGTVDNGILSVTPKDPAIEPYTATIVDPTGHQDPTAVPPAEPQPEHTTPPGNEGQRAPVGDPITDPVTAAAGHPVSPSPNGSVAEPTTAPSSEPEPGAIPQPTATSQQTSHLPGSVEPGSSTATLSQTPAISDPQQQAPIQGGEQNGQTSGLIGHVEGSSGQTVQVGELQTPTTNQAAHSSEHGQQPVPVLLPNPVDLLHQADIAAAPRPFQSGGGNEGADFRTGPWYKPYGARRSYDTGTLVEGRDEKGSFVEIRETGERFPSVRAAADRLLQEFANRVRREYSGEIGDPNWAERALASFRTVEDTPYPREVPPDDPRRWQPARDLAAQLGAGLPPEVSAALRLVADHPVIVRAALTDFIATAPAEFRALVRDLLLATPRVQETVHDFLAWQNREGLVGNLLSRAGRTVLGRVVDPIDPAVAVILGDSRTADPAFRAGLADMLGADRATQRGLVTLLDSAGAGHIDTFQEATPAVAAIVILPGEGKYEVFLSSSAKGGDPVHDPFVQVFLDQRREYLEAARVALENQLLDDRRGEYLPLSGRDGTDEATRYPWRSDDVAALREGLQEAGFLGTEDVKAAEALAKYADRQLLAARAARLPEERVAAFRRDAEVAAAELVNARKMLGELTRLQDLVESRRADRLAAVLAAHPEDGAPLAEIDRLLGQLGRCGEMGASDDAAAALRKAMPSGLTPEQVNARLADAFRRAVFGAVEIGTHRLTEPGPRSHTETGFVHGTWKDACPNCKAAIEYFHGSELNRDGVSVFDEPRPGQSGGGFEGAQDPWTRGEPPASPIRTVQEAQLGAMLMTEFRDGAAGMVDRLRTALAVMAGVDPSQLEEVFHHDRLNSGTVPADVPVDELIASGNARELVAAFIGAAFGSGKPFCFDQLVLNLVHAGDTARLEAAGLDVRALREYVDFLQRRLNYFPKPEDFTHPGNLADFFSPGSDTASDLRDGDRRAERPDKNARQYLIPLSELELHRIGLSSREVSDILIRARTNQVIADNLAAGRAPWSTGESSFLPMKPGKPSAWFVRNTVEGDMPAVAGPSGTTTRVFAVAKFLAPPPELAEDFAAALTGYLVSSHHHSMSEVVQGLDVLRFYDTQAGRRSIARSLNLENLYGHVPGLVRHEPTVRVPDSQHPGFLQEPVVPFLHPIEVRPPDLLDVGAQLHWARHVYAEVGGSSGAAVVDAVVRVLSDVPRLDGGAGYSLDEIASVHRYLFLQEHDLADGRGGTLRAMFDADPEIAAAWQRMASGTVDPRDLVLLDHELAEVGYFREHPDATLLEAHRAANQVANWERIQPHARRQALYDYVRTSNGDPGLLREGGGGSGDGPLPLGRQPGRAGPGPGDGQGEFTAPAGGTGPDDPVPGGGQEGVLPQGEQRPLAGSGDDRQLTRPFQSGGHYQDSHSQDGSHQNPEQQNHSHQDPHHQEPGPGQSVLAAVDRSDPSWQLLAQARRALEAAGMTPAAVDLVLPPHLSPRDPAVADCVEAVLRLSLATPLTGETLGAVVDFAFHRSEFRHLVPRQVVDPQTGRVTVVDDVEVIVDPRRFADAFAYAADITQRQTPWFPVVENRNLPVAGDGAVTLASAVPGTRPWVLAATEHMADSWYQPKSLRELGPVSAAEAAVPVVFAFDDIADAATSAAHVGQMDAVVLGPDIIGQAPDAVAAKMTAAAHYLRPGGVLIVEGSDDLGFLTRHGLPESFDLVYRGVPASGGDVAAWLGDVPGGEREAGGRPRIVLRRAEIRGPSAIEEALSSGPGPAARPPRPERLVTHLRPGPAEMEELWGILEHNQRMFQAVADRYGIVIEVRPSNPESVDWLKLGGVPKPPDIKMKTINPMDVVLGAKEMVGAVGFFEPLSEAQLKALIPDDAEFKAYNARRESRHNEYQHNKYGMEQLVIERKFRVEEGVIYPFAAFPAREPAAHLAGPLLVAPDGQVFGGLAPDGSRLPVRDWTPGLDPELGPPVTGDHDMFDIRFPDGTRLSFERPPTPDGEEPEVWFTRLVNEAAMLQDQIRGKGPETGVMQWRGFAVQHGATMYYTPKNDYERTVIIEPIIARHAPGGGERLVRFAPGRPPSLVTSATPLEGTP